MKRTTVFLILSWTAVFLWMALIFSFSAQPSDESSAVSSPFVRAYLFLFHPEYEDLSPGDRFELEENASFLVRKTAHFSIYTVLGALLFSAVSRTLPAAKLRIPLAFLTGALYAVSDEFHQSFVPGRSCEIRDMTIDSAGVLLGVLLCAGAAVLIRRRRNPNR